MKDFYLIMQKKAADFNCFIFNGLYVPDKKGKVKKYSLFITNDRLISKPAKIPSIDSLVDFAKKNFRFSGYDYKNTDFCTWLNFYNLKITN